MKKTLNLVLIAAFVLGAFAVVGVGLVAFTQAMTAERIAANERAALMGKLKAVVPGVSIENDPLADVVVVSDPALLGGETTEVYRVRSGGEVVALILDPMVPDGYAGPIKLLVAVRSDGTLGGVRVLSHHETPGLGDKIEERKSDWVLSFDGKSLEDPPPEQWEVERDGGVFDQFTGATITPRSIVRAVKRTLVFVEEKGADLYADPATEPAAEPASAAVPANQAGRDPATVSTEDAS
ncbi:electron transport complex subunit RsxG [Thiococcus pfennigii]|uniref:electron transport complex subunit RsxG n=1 Tax=Thiococcus pfennigii TaxID=1057 RepID=UPI001907EE5B|nr:electron transport complex subunit RsxG [Thiococcus pfennigii]MBK1699854.1 electron transport complex subunit RsxG [Thiococcus pfennigii]